MEQPPHPPLLISLCAGMLVLLALIASADATIFGSDRFKEIGTIVRMLLVMPLVFVAIGGVCVLWAGNAAYNIGHRSWKLAGLRAASAAASAAPPPWPWPTVSSSPGPALPAQNALQREIVELAKDIKDARRASARLLLVGSVFSVASIAALLIAVGAIIYSEIPAADAVKQARTSRRTADFAVRSSFELLGTIDGFAPGSSEPVGADLQAKLVSMRGHWCSERRAGRDGLLLAIGATDRVPLGSLGRQRFGSNSGLAQSRAARVGTLLFPGDRSNMITLSAGPDTTPADTPVKLPTGFAMDRKVTLWAIWGPAPHDRLISECVGVLR